LFIMRSVSSVFALGVMTITLVGCGDPEPNGSSSVNRGGTSGVSSARTGPYSSVQCKVQNPGTINAVNCTLAALGNKSAIEPLTSLVNTLANGEDGTLASLTGPLNDLTALNGGPLGPLTELVQMLAAKDDAALAPLIVGLNSVLGGIMSGQSNSDISSSLQSLFAGGLPGATATSNASDSSGLLSSVTDLTGNLLGNTILDSVNRLVVQLVDPATGALSPLTGQLDAATDTTTGPLAPLTDLVNTLANTNDQALEPVIAGLNALVGGLASGQSLSTGALAPVASALGI